MKTWLPLTADERTRALAETSGRRSTDPETLIVMDDDAPGCVILSSNSGSQIAGALRRGVGTHIARTVYDGKPYEWSLRIPAKQFRGWPGCFRVQPGHGKPARAAHWKRGEGVAPFGGDGGEE